MAGPAYKLGIFAGVNAEGDETADTSREQGDNDAPNPSDQPRGLPFHGRCISVASFAENTSALACPGHNHCCSVVHRGLLLIGVVIVVDDGGRGRWGRRLAVHGLLVVGLLGS